MDMPLKLHIEVNLKNADTKLERFLKARKEYIDAAKALADEWPASEDFEVKLIEK